MELSNEFDVSVPVQQAWMVLTDLERIAPCLPGAELQEVEGALYRGIVKIKVGPITAQYKGSAHFVEKDEEGYRAVLSAAGRDTRGQGTASASIVALLTESGPITHVSVVTDLTITGKVAQFGRGVIGDVSVKLLDQFVANLETTVLASIDQDTDSASGQAVGGTAKDASPGAGADPQSGAAGSTATGGAPVREAAREERGDDGQTPPSSNGSGGVRTIDGPSAEPIDLLQTAGSPLARRALPLLGLVAAVLIALGLIRRRRR